MQQQERRLVWSMKTVNAIRKTWGVREFILATVKRDFVSKYLGTQLGWFWAVAQPLAMILIYTLLFAEIMRPAWPGQKGPFAYSINLCAGIVIWQLFSELVSRSVGIFVHNANLLKKVAIPKFALPVIATLTAVVNFALITGLFLIFLVAVDAWPGWGILAVLPVLVIVVAFAVGLGILLGTINVFYRDVEQTVGIALNFWFWLTPIVYPARALPEWLASALEWNPLWPLVHFAQTIVLDHVVPDPRLLTYPAVFAALLLILGLHAFRRLSADIVDEL